MFMCEIGPAGWLSGLAIVTLTVMVIYTAVVLEAPVLTGSRIAAAVQTPAGLVTAPAAATPPRTRRLHLCHLGGRHRRPAHLSHPRVLQRKHPDCALCQRSRSVETSLSNNSPLR